MLLQLLIAAAQGFTIRDVGWHNWGLRRNVDFRRTFHDFVILGASAWNWKPPQDPQWTQISAMSHWQSFIKSEQGIMHVLAGQELAKRAQGILHRVIPAFNEIVKLLQHPVQRDEAQEMRPFLRTDPREVPIFDQQSVSSRGPLLPGESCLGLLL